jgi:beta-alanine degradation protein BauB
MRRSIRVTTVVSMMFALTMFCAASAMAQDPAKVAPDLYKVRLDNAEVRVLEVKGKAGQKAPMHKHRDYVVYSLTDGSARHTDAKGAASDSSLKAGQAIWRDAESHASEVVSDIHVLLFELKGRKATKRARAAAADDPTKVDPDHYKVLLENDRVRVLEFRGSPGNETPMHSHPGYVTYNLDGGKTTFNSKGKTVEVVSQAGEVRWHDAETHSGKNTGETELRVLIVEIK